MDSLMILTGFFLLNCYELNESVLVTIEVITYIATVWPSGPILCQWSWSSLYQVIACRLCDAKALPDAAMTICQLDTE